jgi:hypothetical protein
VTSWSQLTSSKEGGFRGLLPCTKLYKDADTEWLYCLLCP